MKADLIKVYTDDYEALYIDGVMEDSGHSLHLDCVLESLIGKEVSSFKSYYIEQYELETSYGWEFPKHFTEFDESHLK